jgi:hypothetical protein
MKTHPERVLARIVEIVSRNTGVPSAAITNPGRLGNVVVARSIVVENLLECLPLLSAADLGRLFNRSTAWGHYAAKQKVVDTRFRKLKKTIHDEITTSK